MKILALGSVLVLGLILSPHVSAKTASYGPSAAPSCLTGQTGSQCKAPLPTHCNANNPNGGGCPQSGTAGPVCGNGEHTGNPHCVTATPVPTATIALSATVETIVTIAPATLVPRAQETPPPGLVNMPMAAFPHPVAYRLVHGVGGFPA